MLFVVIFGLGFKLAVVDPMIRHGVLPLAIATMALAIIMKESAKDFFSSEAQTFPSPFPAGAVDVLGVSLSLQHIAIIAVAFVAIGALQWFVTATRTGRQMQATRAEPGRCADPRHSGRAHGHADLRHQCGLAVLASVLISPIYLAKFSNGDVIGLFAFIAAIVGGFNQVRGRACRRPHRRRRRQPRRRLHLLLLPARRAAGAAGGDHPREAGGPVRPPRGAPGMSEITHSLQPRRRALAEASSAASTAWLLTLLAGAVILWFLPVGMGRYGTYVLTLWLVTAIAVMGLNLTSALPA